MMEKGVKLCELFEVPGGEPLRDFAQIKRLSCLITTKGRYHAIKFGPIIEFL